MRSVDSGNARMTVDKDTVLMYGLLVSDPPIIHHLLSFKAGEDKGDRNLLLAKPFVK